ncbi:hypothetical protein APHWI1_0282 [Anaplasma phagocytophilum str. ApWI1]|uniref:Uncharacterized protein n=2 Tax=Anaplasma phagocytophilum TaxID=948 RepID=Q2GJT6_ANAPZ|nr:hypothetical protein APH_0788 [Anaplasma phagocytophilum str. HZ]AGR79477.1 hypothetical protein YYU_03680 [Anaplasma phagocytophilum str. HZ2]AGR80725.1 hypothetical protein WSQ_03675 [Anaplasma phagocytophilum str. JM]AGR81978.1 hypothetical protein YYY_03670 [Anaplasma phagocytophilum str. Dog2]KJV59873.1 hypothetical protein APHWEB_1234 [Anaplasma phagocytophilum str. Webster]KJV82176.1 hypothetical protein APHHGE2_1081 [Anaplasma phagocytophilum str. HGE2]KJV84439.1 hypothetical prote
MIRSGELSLELMREHLFPTANIGSSLAGSDKFRPHYGGNVCN